MAQFKSRLQNLPTTGSYITHTHTHTHTNTRKYPDMHSQSTYIETHINRQRKGQRIYQLWLLHVVHWPSVVLDLHDLCHGLDLLYRQHRDQHCPCKIKWTCVNSCVSRCVQNKINHFNSLHNLQEENSKPGWRYTFQYTVQLRRWHYLMTLWQLLVIFHTSPPNITHFEQLQEERILLQLINELFIFPIPSCISWPFPNQWTFPWPNGLNSNICDTFCFQQITLTTDKKPFSSNSGTGFTLSSATGTLSLRLSFRVACAKISKYC